MGFSSLLVIASSIWLFWFDVNMSVESSPKIDKYDTVMLFSGDSDFSGLLSYFKNKGKKIVIVCSRPRMSKELYEVADKFIPAESLKDFLHYKNNTPPR